MVARTIRPVADAGHRLCRLDRWCRAPDRHTAECGARRHRRKTQGISIGFGQWMQFGVPLALVMLLICWWYLTHLNADPLGAQERPDMRMIAQERAGLGRSGRSSA